MEQANENINTSLSIWQVVEEDAVFSPLKHVNKIRGSYLLLEYISDNDDGIFPNVQEYINFTHEVENEGVSAYLNWLTKNNLKYDFGYCTIIRDTIYSREAILEFKKPIRIIVAYVNDEPELIEANKIHGSFVYEFSWNDNGSQDKVANNLKVFFDCIKYELV